MSIHTILRFITGLLTSAGLAPDPAARWSAVITAAGVVILALALLALLNKVVGPIVKHIAEKTPTKVDDILLRQGFIYWVWWLLACGVLQNWLPPSLAHAYPTASTWVATLLQIVNIGLLTKLVVELIKGIFLITFDNDKVEEEARRLREADRNDEEYHYVPSHNLKGLQQMMCIVVICLGVILMLATLLGKNPLIIISGLGAGTAVLMLVFKDSIMGVVAGIQLTVNDMLRPGDWIVAPAFGANGRVQEVTLATVKVLNWDHTIITIPPYNLISGSFQNYRRMEETGGRRVARSFNIDMSTVRFVTQAEAERYAQTPWGAGIDWSARQVNLTVFRRYLEHYVANVPTLRPDMLYMIRELEPTPQGLPIQIYFFTSQTVWPRFEGVQAEVLDHVLATVGDFGLRVYQLAAHIPEPNDN